MLVAPPRRTYPLSRGPGWRVRRRLLPGTRSARCPRPAMPHAASHAEVRTPVFGPARSAPAGKESVPRRVAVTRHLSWTLRRRSLVKAPAPVVRKVCPKSKWTVRETTGIIYAFVVSDLVSTCGNRDAAACCALTELGPRQDQPGEIVRDRTAVTQARRYRETGVGKRRRRSRLLSGPSAPPRSTSARPSTARSRRSSSPPAAAVT